MAGNIKGLTVEIDGNVTKLSKAIATVNTDAKKLQRELRGVTTLLEYDPKNVVLLEQKQRKLNEALEDQADKLKELQDLEKAYSEQLGPRTEEEAKDFESLQREIVATSRASKRPRGRSPTSASSRASPIPPSESSGRGWKASGGA